MNTFDRHLLREWLQILGFVLLAVVGLLVVQVMYDEFRQLRENGARGIEVWKYFGVAIPGFFPVVLPMALLVSLTFTLGKLHRANELTAMRAAGVGFMRMMAPVWIVGLGACGVSWWLNAEVAPWSIEQQRALDETFEFRRLEKSVQPDRIGATFGLAFDNPDANRMWFFNRYSKYLNRGFGVSVSQMDIKRRELFRLVATEASFDAARRGWTFKDGRVLTFAAETGELASSEPFKERFEEKFHEEPGLMLLVDRRPKDLTLPELTRVMNYFEVQKNPKRVPYAVRYFGLIADAFGPLIVIAIAIPFAVTGVRVNPAVGVSKSLGLFLLYYVFANTATSLATKEILSPELAAWVPNAGMTLLAGWFLARLR